MQDKTTQDDKVVTVTVGLPPEAAERLVKMWLQNPEAIKAEFAKQGFIIENIRMVDGELVIQ